MTFSEWAAFYDKKNPEDPFSPTPGYDLYFVEAKGFCEVQFRETMAIIGQLAGDGRFFRDKVEEVARKLGIKKGGTICIRKEIRACIRLFGYRIEREEKLPDDIEVGDKVMAWGENGEEEAEVLRTMQPHHVEVYNLVCSDVHTMATLSQPFLTEDGAWVTLEDLKMKQRLKNAGEVHAVSFSGDRRVYDLQVSGENTYIADYALGKTNTMPAFGVGGAQPTQEQAAAMEAVAAQAASQAGAPQMGVPQAQAGAPQTLGVPGLAKPASELSSEELMQLLTGQPNFKADPFGLRGADGGVKNTASVPNWITAESIYKYLQSIGQIDKKVVSRAAPDT